MHSKIRYIDKLGQNLNDVDVLCDAPLARGNYCTIDGKAYKITSIFYGSDTVVQLDYEKVIPQLKANENPTPTARRKKKIKAVVVVQETPKVEEVEPVKKPRKKPAKKAEKVEKMEPKVTKIKKKKSVA